ncbi:hypothetical protein Pa4123_73950 [Phytohabitans aurantiacus]|uniref:Uncharacterized protein n=1 Tax=Phytohabitans aurantiacus TaxID=3016789 RepID=A0ABQ5R5Q6_9ACTN|nr:hypothetical protein Pa4123_73950 [Phytohabitans aurantiacus]
MATGTVRRLLTFRPSSIAHLAATRTELGVWCLAKVNPRLISVLAPIRDPMQGSSHLRVAIMVHGIAPVNLPDDP